MPKITSIFYSFGQTKITKQKILLKLVFQMGVINCPAQIILENLVSNTEQLKALSNRFSLRFLGISMFQNSSQIQNQFLKPDLNLFSVAVLLQLKKLIKTD